VRNPARIFISYSHWDLDIARKIVGTLKSADLDVWIDESSLAPGENWLTAIDEALRDAGYLLVLLSAMSLRSTWVQHEWTAMLARQLGGKGGGLVIPLRLEDVQPPPLLEPLQRVDLFSDFEVGLAALVSFFRDETQSLGRRKTEFSSDTYRAWELVTDANLTEDVLRNLDRRTIRRLALQCITLQELMSFCIDTETDRGRIGGSSLNENILFLLELLDREGRIEEFLQWLARENEKCVRAAIMKYMPELFRRE
jgi:hypothetical protein